MTWLRLDDETAENEQIIRAGELGAKLHTWGKLYAARNLTDGRVPAGRLTALCDFSALRVPRGNDAGVPMRADAIGPEVEWIQPDPHRIADHLVRVNLWARVEDGYQILDYLATNPSKAEVLAKRDRERKRKGGKDVLAEDEQPADTLPRNPQQGAAESSAGCRPPVPVPVPVPPSLRSDKSPRSPGGEHAREADGEGGGAKGTVRATMASKAGFARFWAAYPRKVGRLNALMVWQRRGLEPITEHVLAGLARVKLGWTEPRFIPHPTTWLTRGGWEDEPEPAPAPPPPRITPARTQEIEGYLGRWSMSMQDAYYRVPDEAWRQAVRQFPSDAPTADVRAWLLARANGVHA